MVQRLLAFCQCVVMPYCTTKGLQFGSLCTVRTKASSNFKKSVERFRDSNENIPSPHLPMQNIQRHCIEALTKDYAI